MRLLGNRLLIKPLPQQLKSQGGLHLAERYASESENHVLFRVLAVGPGRLLKNGTYVPIEAKVGDRIIAHSFAGTQHAFEDRSKIIDANEVMMVLP